MSIQPHPGLCPPVRGDFGGSPNYTSPTDQRLVRRAINERWPVSDRIRQRVMDHTEDILDDKEADPHLKMSACRTVMQADALNLKEKEIKARLAPKVIVHTQLTTQELEDRIRELSNDLGIAAPVAALEAKYAQGVK